MEADLAEIVADFKTRAAATSGIDGVWAIQEYLESRRRELDRKYDDRYSQRPLVFVRLLREGKIRMEHAWQALGKSGNSSNASRRCDPKEDA